MTDTSKNTARSSQDAKPESSNSSLPALSFDERLLCLYYQEENEEHRKLIREVLDIQAALNEPEESTKNKKAPRESILSRLSSLGEKAISSIKHRFGDPIYPTDSLQLSPLTKE